MKAINNNTYPRLAAFALAALVFAPTIHAVNPPPDGAYPGLNTAEGQNALLSLNTNIGNANTAVGWFSLKSDVNGSFNTAIGAGTLLLNLGDPNTGKGTENTAVGAAALLSNTVGYRNTANGDFSLFSNTTGFYNTAMGSLALYSNETGGHNAATGGAALYTNTTGSRNTATGQGTLFSNTTADDNTADGAFALYSNTTGYDTTAVGSSALFSNTEGFNNTAIGYGALANNTTGSWNSAIGDDALSTNTTGHANTACGNAALIHATGSGNTALGTNALFNITSSFNNIAVGGNAGCVLTAGANNIYIGNLGVGTESNAIRIGREIQETDCFGFSQSAHTDTYIAGISGQTAADGVAVYINADGKLGTLTSSARFKTAIKPMDNASEAILALKPVTFRYKREIDNKGIPQFGLVAEDVEKVNPELVARDSDGKPYTVRYEAVNAMLLNEFLKEHRKVEQQDNKLREQQATIDDLKSGMQALMATVKEQAAQIQKVSDKIELHSVAPKLVVNRQ